MTLFVCGVRRDGAARAVAVRIASVAPLVDAASKFERLAAFGIGLLHSGAARNVSARRLPQQVFQEIADRIVAQSGAAVERKFDARRSGKAAGARIEHHDAGLDVAG